MKLLKIVGTGILGWVLIFVIISAFVGFKIYDNIWVQLLGVVIVGIIAFVLVGILKPKSLSAALNIAVIWLIIGLALDWIITTRFNPGIFTLWHVWSGYFLIFLIPFLRIKK